MLAVSRRERRNEDRPSESGEQVASGSVRPIRQYGDSILFQRCRVVRQFDQELRDLVADMFATMRHAEGVGLAANQIGVDAQVFVMDCPDGEGGRLLAHVVNPQLISVSDHDVEVGIEGCLSIPGVHAELPRYRRAAVTGFDSFGAAIQLDGVGMAARCLQHETDHLAGRLYVSRLPSKQRRAVLEETDVHSE